MSSYPNNTLLMTSGKSCEYDILRNWSVGTDWGYPDTSIVRRILVGQKNILNFNVEGPILFGRPKLSWSAVVNTALRKKVSVVNEKGESQNRCYKKQSPPNFLKNKRTWTYQGIRNVLFFRQFDVLCFL